MTNKDVSGKGAFIKPCHTAGAVIFALVMLFNPNFNLFDILPDFIGYFILVKVFDVAADCAPYFEEARSGFLKLAYVSLAKIPATVIMMIAQANNTVDNDIVALFSLVFAAIEIILLIPTVRNIFEALIYLGERTGAESLIKGNSLASTDNLRSFTVAFVIFKSALYALPEMTKLTRSVELSSGTYVAYGSRYYPFAILFSLTIGFVIGSIWLNRMIKYVKRIHSEGKFHESLMQLSAENSADEYTKKRARRSLGRTFLLFLLAAVFSLDLTFDNFNHINLLPNVIFAILFTVGAIRLSRNAQNSGKMQIGICALGVTYSALSLVAFIFTAKFLTDFGYSALYQNSNNDAVSAYNTVIILSAVELLMHIALLVLFVFVMRRFVLMHMGVSPHNETYNRADRDYHSEILRKVYIYASLLGLSGICSFVSVIVNGNVKLIFTNPNDVTQPTIITSSLPWFPLVATVITVIYIFYSVYFFNYIKEEIKN